MHRRVIITPSRRSRAEACSCSLRAFVAAKVCVWVPAGVREGRRGLGHRATQRGVVRARRVARRDACASSHLDITGQSVKTEAHENDAHHRR